MQGEYRGDFSRDSFHPWKHLSRVLMQQGRVQLDADWNEQTAILLHYLWSLGADLIGQNGGPAVEGGAPGTGFFINTKPTDLKGDFWIEQGHYYVDGILCELDSAPVPIKISDGQGPTFTLLSPGLEGVVFEKGQYVEIFDDIARSTPAFFQIASVSGNVITPDSAGPISVPNAKIRHAVTYKTQPDYPLSPGYSLPPGLPEGDYIVYLDVWERHITWLEDGSCREVALGGPDTATRAKLVWQVKWGAANLNIQNGRVTDADWRKYVIDNLQPENRGLLKAQVSPQTVSTDPCTISPASTYRGAENQLYRVEINNVTASSSSQGTFKWSRENGSVVFPILELATAAGQTTVYLANLGRDERLSLDEGDWVEIVDDTSILMNQPGTLLNVVGVDRVNIKVTLAGTVNGTVGSNAANHPLLRRWDQTNSDASKGAIQLAPDGAVPIVEGDWIPLEDGIQIQFQAGGNYRTGDYWLIPARTATGNIQWPMIQSTQSKGQQMPASLPPHGIQHYYAPLAQVPSIQAVNPAPIDLRRTFATQAK